MSVGQELVVETGFNLRVVLHAAGRKSDLSDEALTYAEVFSGPDLLVWVKGYSSNPDGAGILRNDRFPLYADAAELFLVSLVQDWNLKGLPENSPCAIAIKSACRNHPAWLALDAASGKSDPCQLDSYRGLRRLCQELREEAKQAREKYAALQQYRRTAEGI